MTDGKPDKVDVGAEIKTALWWLTVATVVVYLGLAAVGVFQLKVAHTNEKTTTRIENGLCSLRSDLEVRVKASRTFLEEHPEGFSGVPPKAIQDGIDNQQRTIIALKDLHCE